MNNAPQVPSFLAGLIHDNAQKALTIAATYLTSHGLLESSQSVDFVQAGVGIAMFAVSIGWTLAANEIRQRKYEALLNAPPPSPTPRILP